MATGFRDTVKEFLGREIPTEEYKLRAMTNECGRLIHQLGFAIANTTSAEKMKEMETELLPALNEMDKKLHAKGR